MQPTASTATMIYNSLPSVEQANAALEAINRTEVLLELCRIIAKHNLQDAFGIRLLHKHNDIESHQIMVEIEEVTTEGKTCLATAPRTNVPHAFATANSWKLAPGSIQEWQPLEYSTDAVVTACASTVATSHNFFQEFKAMLEKQNVVDILGPCVVDREFYKKHRPAQPSILAETTDPDRRANIVQFVREQAYASEELIQTMWQATKASMESAQSCVVACISVSACVKEGNGTHNKVTRHNKGSHVHTAQ